VTDIQENLHGVSRNIDRVLHDREQQATLDWLTSVDYSSQQNDFIARRQEGTGEWLVELDEFQQWKNNKDCILFCPGIPGSGKTMIVSIVVDHLFKSSGMIPVSALHSCTAISDSSKTSD